MKRKAVIPRELAQADLHAAIDHYLTDSGPAAAHAFIEEVERAFAHLARHPASGSPRYAHDLGLPGLRFWPLSRYPYLVFYVERTDTVDVWRVLHGRRAIPAWMAEPQGA